MKEKKIVATKFLSISNMLDNYCGNIKIYVFRVSFLVITPTVVSKIIKKTCLVKISLVSFYYKMTLSFFFYKKGITLLSSSPMGGINSTHWLHKSF